MEDKKLSGAPFSFLKSHVAHGEDCSQLRREELWSPANEELLCEWAREWHARVRLHNMKYHYWSNMETYVKIPATIIPLVVAGLWGRLPEDKSNIVATLTMTFSGVLNGLLSIMKPEARAERHISAVQRYRDLISDIEEILLKEPISRPEVDTTVRSFKMRSDSLLREAPHIGIISDSELDF